MRLMPRLVLCNVVAGLCMSLATHVMAQSEPSPPELTAERAKAFLTAAGLQTCSRRSTERFRAALLSIPRCSFSVSASWKPIVKQGLRLVMGSWKIMAIPLPRTARSSSHESFRRSRPPNSTWPWAMPI